MLMIVGIILVVIIGLFLVGEHYVNLLANEVDKLPSGEDAIKVMSEKEKVYFENNFRKVKAHMSSSEVEGILGTL